MSCNGCRVLRKGCSDSCILRQCLRWIDSPDAQGHATVFVAKFFGRAGMMALIGSVPENQRPALFQSLLYEACGRTINPVFGAVGLLCSGNWKLCQEAVETVMKGGLLCPPSSGTGRPGSAFMHAAASGGGGHAKFPKIRLGRGYINSVPMFHQNQYHHHHLPESMVNSAEISNSFAAKLKQEEEILNNKVEENNNETSVNCDAVRIKRRLEEGEEGVDHHHAAEDEDLEEEEVKCLSRTKFKAEQEQEDRHEEDEEETAAAATAACNDEVGLDLTLGSLSSSSSAWKTSLVMRRGPKRTRTTMPAATITATATATATAAAAGAGTGTRSPPSSTVVVRTCSPCHSSEADSDTTDLSISIQSQSSRRGIATTTTRSDYSTTKKPQEVLLDLLH